MLRKVNGERGREGHRGKERRKERERERKCMSGRVVACSCNLEPNVFFMFMKVLFFLFGEVGRAPH